MTPRIAVLAMAIFLFSAANASAIGIDRDFGNRGWAAITNAGTRSISTDSIACTMPLDRLFVAGGTRATKSGKSSGGFVAAMHRDGSRVARFAHSGVLTTKARWEAAEVIGLDHKAFLVLIETRRGSKHTWKLQKLSRHGRFFRKFGSNGAVNLNRLAASKAPPTVLAVGSRILVAHSALDGNESASRITALDRNGTLDTSFGSGGRYELPYSAESLSTGVDRIYVTGYLGKDGRITRLIPDGTPDTNWGHTGTTTAQLPEPIRQDFIRNSYPDVTMFTSYTQARVVGNGEVVFTAVTNGYLTDTGWAVKFDRLGNPVLSWGSGGFVDLGSDFQSQENGVGSSSSEFAPLGGGRAIKVTSLWGGEYARNSYDVDFQVFGPSGKSRGKGAANLALAKTNLIDFRVGESGREAVLCKKTTKGIGVARLRL